MKTPEKYEKDEIDAYLKAIGAYNVKPASYGFGASGTSDRLCCILGTFWAIEVKREGKLPTKLQAIRINEVRAAGGQATWGVAFKVKNEIESWRQRRLKELSQTLGR